VQRLAFEELLAHRLGLLRLRERAQQHSAPKLIGTGELRAQLLAALPFAPTGAQQRVIGEIDADLSQPRPMLRLVQGDVGAGKTLVAAAAATRAVESGWQVALMAPTELLAEQHFLNFSAWFEPLGIRVAWLSGRQNASARNASLAEVTGGTAQIVVGTHALFQADVQFAKLGLVIVDEQHRFGVHQRLALSEKGGGDGLSPHQLTMTATPIPRTLAMTAYADLDLSVIDELPPGRTPVTTVALAASRRDEVIERVAAAIEEKRQVYWVCTLVEESEALDAQAAADAANELAEAIPDARIGLVHGRLKAAQKERVMQAFKAAELDLLVATTVIEVGVDVPAASLMIIENAERLGLAQLHQLRGRVGRGSTQSACVLMYQTPLSQNARARLQTLRETNDGFAIAEKDLEIRGAGEVLGTRQTGMVTFRIADLSRDAGLLPAVQMAADALLGAHPAHAEPLIRRWLGEDSENYARA
jgi:ATP-dependent DNA helicase RecG